MADRLGRLLFRRDPHGREYPRALTVLAWVLLLGLVWALLYGWLDPASP